jgi:glycosyltransferase involved in cell wall biosynthesis
MVVHQFLPSLVPGDATGTAAVQLQWLLRRLGHVGELYGGEVHRSLRVLARPASELAPAPGDLVLYHHGIQSDLVPRLLTLECKRGVVYHNVSPASFYRGTQLEPALTGARAQLAALAPHVALSLGVSAYNAAELRAAGHANAAVVPLFVEPARFSREYADAQRLARWSRGGPAVLTVSRVVPHKRMEDLLSLHEAVRQRLPNARLLVAGGYEAGGRYFRGLARRAKEMGGVTFLGRLDHPGLVAAYRAASVFVSMSEHEGFGVPLVEAMAADLPVLAFGAAAVPETLGGAGICFDEKHFGYLAEVVRELHVDGALRARVLGGQRERLAQLSPRAAEARLAEALATVEPPPRPRPRPSPRTKPRVGVIVQRYGDVGGGAEAHARMVVDRLSPHWDITVLTSCAADHHTWANHFPEGASRVGPAHVLRFPVDAPRDMETFNARSRALFGKGQDRVNEEGWLAAQGPVLPGLQRHLSEQAHAYDGFVAFTYLYASTAWGAAAVADRTLLVPTAHDEPPLSFELFRDVFERPAALLCNTPEELSLIRARFPAHARARVVGVGVEAPAGEAARFRAKHGLDRPYLLYVGRLEAGKNVPWLLELHAKLRRRFADAPDLVLAGGGELTPRGDGVHCLGRIPEADKWDGLAGALCAVVPSQYESLSLLALEAFSQGIPVLGNGRCEVLAGQVRRSGAGATFTDFASFSEGVRVLGAGRPGLEQRARAFARRHRWEKVVEAYRAELDRVMGKVRP